MMPKRALVVDDDAGMRELVAVRLADRFSVATAPTGEAALRLVRAERFAVAFVDVNMPGMSGLELLQLIREIAPHMEIVVLSAETRNESRALEAGATAFVLKGPDGFARRLEAVVVGLRASVE